MAMQSDQEFAPTKIARAVFPTAFRGYDQDAVRRYLSRLAAALEHQQEYAGLGELEARTPAHERVEELEGELETLRSEIKDLELELVQRSVDGSSTPGAHDVEEPATDAKTDTEFDEHRAIELLGKETARVLESARSAAADILKRAESQAEKRKSDAAAELADAKKQAKKLVADAIAEATELAAKSNAEAEADAKRIAAEADQHRSSVMEESATMLAEAEELAKAEQADAESKADRIVTDAEALRQQVIAELVAERHDARAEMDRMTSARDRLAMSLAVARTELDEVADALIDVSNLSFEQPPKVESTEASQAAEVEDLIAGLDSSADSRPSEKADQAAGKPGSKSSQKSRRAKGRNGARSAKAGTKASEKPADLFKAADDAKSEDGTPAANDSSDSGGADAVKDSSGAAKGSGSDGSKTAVEASAAGDAAAADSAKAADTAEAADTAKAADNAKAANSAEAAGSAKAAGADRAAGSSTAEPAAGDSDAEQSAGQSTSQAKGKAKGRRGAKTSAATKAKASAGKNAASKKTSSKSTAPAETDDRSQDVVDPDEPIDLDKIIESGLAAEVVGAKAFDDSAVSDLNELPADGAKLSLVEGFTTIDLTDGQAAAEQDIDLRNGRADADGDPDPDDGSDPDGQERELVSAVGAGPPGVPEDMITTVSSRTTATQRDRTRGDLLIEEPFTGRLPREFAARDLALTRSGPNFRRQLRRALNDDQSDVLDRLRAGRGEITADELPDFGEQIDRYLAPLRRGLAEIAQAGATAGGQRDLSQTVLDNLVRQLARYIVDKVRVPTVEVLTETTDHDRERILEPIRALYRDFRNIGLPDLTEDALYEAFAIGLYDSIEPAASISWVVDPRSDPDPVCEINRQRQDVVKGVVFPSGHARPLSLPGCRCLVMVADY